MHCHSCVLLTESEIRDVSGVEYVKSNLKTHSVEVKGNFGEKTDGEVAENLSKVLEKHGYSLSEEKQAKSKNYSDFKIAIPLALAFATLFIFLQKIGLVDFIGAGEVSYGTAFAVGLIASLSSCMAVVGGLLLSMSATFAREGDRVKPQIFFHAGRLVSFFILGGAIGAIGSAFTLSGTVTFVLGLIIGLVMLVLGLNLLDVFDWAKKIQPVMPKFLGKHALGISKWNHTATPLLAGIATFFLPCGFTQSMQIFTLTTGSFLKGGLTMLVFALGTFPILALLSFSSVSIGKGRKSGIFFRTVGLIVIMFALLNVINSLVVAGWIEPIFTF